MKPVPPMMKTDISPSPVLSLHHRPFGAPLGAVWCTIGTVAIVILVRASRAGTTNGNCELGEKPDRLEQVSHGQDPDTGKRISRPKTVVISSKSSPSLCPLPTHRSAYPNSESPA